MIVRVMAHPVFFRFGVLLLAMFPIGTKAACTEKDLDSGWLWNYDGTIGGKLRVRATLTFAHAEVAGVYFYATQLKDIRIQGRIIDGTRLVLDELDSSGRVAARFEGTFADEDPRGKFKGSLHCEVIAGFWQKTEAAPQGLPFLLALDSGTSGTLEHRYEVAGAEDDELIHRNAARFCNAVLRRDRRSVASLIQYPIRVRVAGALKSIRNSQELIARYDAIFSPAFQKAIAEAIPRNMFVRDRGIMLGNGEVWFGADGRVIALNNR
jgi:hypothetical protein